MVRNMPFRSRLGVDKSVEVSGPESTHIHDKVWLCEGGQVG